MGLVHAEITLTNAGDVSLFEGGYLQETEIRKVSCVALVDSGAIMLAINENLKIQLGLKVRDIRPAQLADGTVKNLEIVGPIEVRFKNRLSTTNAMVLPGNQEVLLGAIPMEEMDVLIHPGKQELIVNPEHPFKAQMVLK
jgi:clan AA aspartic protease